MLIKQRAIGEKPLLKTYFNHRPANGMVLKTSMFYRGVDTKSIIGIMKFIDSSESETTTQCTVLILS